LGTTLDECAEKYRSFCQKYRSQPKSEKRYHWGNNLLAGMKRKVKSKKSSPGQLTLPWDDWEVNNEEIEKVSSKFVLANCYNPEIASTVLQPPPPE
jgi:putative transposase